MIVYGDPAYTSGLPVLLAQFQARTVSAHAIAMDWLRGAVGNYEVQDALRGLLIHAGQIEQAVQDAPSLELPDETRRQWIDRAQSLTDAAARSLAAAFSLTGENSIEASRVIFDAFETLTIGEEEIAAAPPARLVVKTPEGFAFYALFPEQYQASALRWAKDHAPYEGEKVLAVGIRSIGTGLSALVAAALQAEGWDAKRVTVRPTGHPYTRSVRIAPTEIGEADWALIVDEGPGMSGSSFASVAQALTAAGMSAERIAFLPGHGGSPGGQGGERTKFWWATAPRYVTPLAETRWDSRSICQWLAFQTALHDETVQTRLQRDGHLTGLSDEEQFDALQRKVTIQDLSGGLWRSAVYSDAGQWPAVCAAFERPKYLCAIPNGQALLWKFAGLATERNGKDQAANLYERLTALNRQGWTPTPVCVASGFVAIPWIHGRPLSHTDASEDVLRHIGRYIAAAADSPQSAEEHGAAIDRLADMLYWNAWETLGEDAALKTRAYADAVQNSTWITNSRTYGDGRLFPHQWLQTPEGQILKTGGGHGADHTIVGRQSFAWDVAGATAEWRLDDTTAKPLLNAVEKAIETTIPPHVLTFFCLAYTAFRAGQTALCAQMSGHDPAEQTRLWQAHAVYKSQMANRLPLG